MPNTITSYFEFTPGTKARSNEVDANFSNHRGTLVPIEENTAAASDLTHDLGSTEHRWSIGYLGTVDLKSSTATASLQIRGDTALTAGAFLFQIASTTVARILTTGIPSSSLEANARLLQAETFTANGTSTVPTGTTVCLVFGCGGGGSGGAGSANQGGGGAGGNSSHPALVTLNVTAGDVLSITVGAGGAAVAGPANGVTTGGSGLTGGATFIDRSGTTIFYVAGANGGLGGSSGGTGGAAGGFGYTATGYYGPGGAGGDIGVDGSPGAASPYRMTPISGGDETTSAGGGGGGASGYGPGGAGGAGSTGDGNPGVTASGYGCGGGGGGAGGAANSGGSSGAGGNGILMIYYYTPS